MRPKFLLFYTGLFLAGALFPLSLAPFSYWLIAIASLAVLFASLTGRRKKLSAPLLLALACLAPV